MKMLKNFIIQKRDLLLSLCLITCASAVMSAVILPYKALMSLGEPYESEAHTCAALSVLHPVGITYDLECDLLARFIFSLAENEPYVCQVSIGATIVNRKNSAHFSDDIASIIFNCSPHFSEDMLSVEPNERSRHAARDALMGVDPSGGALYFCRRGNESDLPNSKRLFTANYGSFRFAK